MTITIEPAGPVEVATDLDGDSLQPMPSLEYMRGWLDHLGLHPSAGEVQQLREWATALIDETERLRAAMLDLAVQPGGGRADPKKELSPVELAIFRHLRNTRMSLAEIAKARFISLNTVKTHTKSIYRKVGVHSREELRDSPSL